MASEDRNVLIVIGAPGSGKTTYAKKIADSNSEICCADDYFMVNGIYEFEASKLGMAHGCCKNKFELVMRDCRNPIVANTNTVWADIKHYVFGALYFGYNLEICEPDTSWKHDPQGCFEKCQHNVPIEVIRKHVIRLPGLKAKLQETLPQLFKKVTVGDSIICQQ